MIARERPAVAVADYQMPDIDGLGLVHAVVRDQLPTRVLLLSAFTDSSVSSGAPGRRRRLPVQERGRNEIVDAVLAVARGRTVLPPDLADGLAAESGYAHRATAPRYPSANHRFSRRSRAVSRSQKSQPSSTSAPAPSKPIPRGSTKN